MNLPPIYNVRQVFPEEHIKCIDHEISKSMEEIKVHSLFKTGERVAIAVGSRGIANIKEIVCTLVGILKKLGTSPFIVPAMGSHGGATSQGQVKVLNSLGISEKVLGIPIISDMEVVEIGKTKDGVPVYIDKHAWEADAIVVVNRIKPHTRFRAKNESGLMKMVAVGLGKHAGCSQMHAHGLYPTIIEAARVAISKAPIRLGIGIVENAYEKTAKIAAVVKEDFESKDAELLELAKRLMPSIPVNDVDLLVVKEMGKNISGTGMDVNILGRVSQPFVNEIDNPRIKRIVALDLTEASYGNALGMSLADVITRRFADKINFAATYTNVLAAGVLDRGKMPVVQENDYETIIMALKSIEKLDPEEARIIFIHNTLELSTLKVSQAVYNEIKDLPNIQIVGDNTHIEFDSLGDLKEEWW